MELLKAYGEFGNVESLSELGVNPEQIKRRASVVSIDGKSYSCSYAPLEGNWKGWEAP